MAGRLLKKLDDLKGITLEEARKAIAELRKEKCSGCPRAPHPLIELILDESWDNDGRAAILEALAQHVREDASGVPLGLLRGISGPGALFRMLCGATPGMEEVIKQAGGRP